MKTYASSIGWALCGLLTLWDSHPRTAGLAQPPAGLPPTLGLRPFPAAFPAEVCPRPCAAGPAPAPTPAPLVPATVREIVGALAAPMDQRLLAARRLGEHLGRDEILALYAFLQAPPAGGTCRWPAGTP